MTIYHVLEKRESVAEFYTRAEAEAYINKQHEDVAQYMRVVEEQTK